MVNFYFVFSLPPRSLFFAVKAQLRYLPAARVYIRAFTTSLYRDGNEVAKIRRRVESFRVPYEIFTSSLRVAKKETEAEAEKERENEREEASGCEGRERRREWEGRVVSPPCADVDANPVYRVRVPATLLASAVLGWARHERQITG